MPTAQPVVEHQRRVCRRATAAAAVASAATTDSAFCPEFLLAEAAGPPRPAVDHQEL